MTDVAEWTLVLAPLFDWTVAVFLGVAMYRRPDLLTLRERFVAAIVLAVIASIAAFLVGVRREIVVVDNGAAIILLYVAMLLASVPSAVFLFLVVSGRFRFPSDPRGGTE